MDRIEAKGLWWTLLLGGVLPPICATGVAIGDFHMRVGLIWDGRWKLLSLWFISVALASVAFLAGDLKESPEALSTRALFAIIFGLISQTVCFWFCPLLIAALGYPAP